MIGFIGTEFGFHRFSNNSRITVAQSDWDDPLDGTGVSGMVLDVTKMNVWEIRFQYLGAGAISLHVEDDSTGKFVEVHRILYANNFIVPSVFNPNFHGTIWVDNKSTSEALTLKSSSMAYFIEGKNEFIELQQPQFSSGLQEKTTVTTEVAIFTIRNKSIYAGKKNFIDIILENFSGSIEASSPNNLGNLRVIKNATLGGTPSFSDINTTDSIVEIDTAGTTVTGGIELIDLPLAGKNDKASSGFLNVIRIMIAPGETLTVAGSSTNSATIDAFLFWKELF